MNMSDVEQKLKQAAERLKLNLIVLMEEMGAGALAVQRARESHPVFNPKWGAACNQMSTAVCLSAYFRYLDWYSNKHGKRKGVAVQASSNLVMASSSDQTVVSPCCRLMQLNLRVYPRSPRFKLDPVWEGPLELRSRRARSQRRRNQRGRRGRRQRMRRRRQRRRSRTPALIRNPRG
jgi:hypothetical protein